MLMMDQAAEGNREELRRKLRENFDGRIVRKDLTKKIKEGAFSVAPERQPHHYR